MSALTKIIADKYFAVEQQKGQVPISLLERSVFFGQDAISLKNTLVATTNLGIIAEYKRQSPSKGIIYTPNDVRRITTGYIAAGASALSILTDIKYFGGSNDDITIARKYNECPILRKDFTIDEYQIIEAKSIGADAILLIAAALDAKQIKQFTAVAHNLGLEVIVEIHDSEELDKLPTDVDIIGINNRNLKTMRVDITQSFELIKQLPANAVKISESGISQAQSIIDLHKAGFNGFLMGEYFTKNDRPEVACAEFIKQVQLLIDNK